MITVRGSDVNLPCAKRHIAESYNSIHPQTRTHTLKIKRLIKGKPYVSQHGELKLHPTGVWDFPQKS